MSGFITAIVEDGRCVCTDDRPVPWWSFSKTVLAAAVLVLAARGRIGLDEQVEGRPFTVRHLTPWPVGALLERVGHGLLFRPGEGWAYSNVGSLLVRHLIEQACGWRLQDALQRLVLAPLGIARTAVAETPEVLEATAWGNARGDDPGWVFHGLMVGPAGDAAMFLHRLLDGSLLSPSSLAEMRDWRPAFGPVAAPIDGRPWLSADCGLGLFRARSAAGWFVGHSGAGPGSVAAVYRQARTVACFAKGDSMGLVEDESTRLGCLTRREEPI